ncbi:MAG: Fic family protein [Candidatus Acidiferrales bacterium]
MIFKSADLRKEELEVIAAIAQMHKSVKYSLSTPSRWGGLLRRNTLARAIRGSNSIEGYLVTAEDAIAAVEGDEPLEAGEETWHAVTGYRNAMTYVLQLAKDSSFIFNDGFLRSLHFMMLYYDLAKHPGNWRPGSIYVRDEAKGENVYEGPPFDAVAKLIGELIEYLNGSRDGEHTLVKAAMAHLNLTMIHPFSDGNGRMARCLQTLVLAAKGIVDPTFCSIEEYLGRNTQDYYDILAETGRGKWNPQRDSRPWIRFNLTAHYRQAGTLVRRTLLIKKLWDELEREIKKRSLPERIIGAIADAAMGYRVRSATYRNFAQVSKVVASRDLRAAVESGLLIPTGERRGRIYRASDEIRELAVKIRGSEPRGIPDPFQKGVIPIVL